MSSIAVTASATGTGAVSLVAPVTNTNQTLTLPDNTGTLVSTGSTNVVTPAMLTQPFTAGTAQASTSGTSIDFTSIPSWVKRITVMFSSVSTSGSSIVEIRLGTSGGVEATGYLSGIMIGSSVQTSTTGFITLGALAAATRQGQFIISNLSGNTWSAMGNMYRSNDGVVGALSATKSLSGTLDRVRITTVNGTDTFDAGTINILWE